MVKMASITSGFVFLTVLVLCGVSAQENALPRIPSSLLECYQNVTLMNRDLRLPSTMQMFIDLVRRIEEHPEMVNRDIREVAIQIIHRFKLDGIQKSSRISASSGVVPFSPSGYQFFKHRIALTEMLQGNAFTFPNDTLTSVERCSLHHMLSSTIELEVRGDEGTVCNRLSQYRTQRLPREAKNIKSDVEVLDQNLIDQMNEKGHMQVDPAMDEPEDAESIDVGVQPGPRNMEQTVSQCPVESGLVHSQWGAVAVGPLLMGIGAGLQTTRVSIRELTSKNTTYSGIIVDNRFALTLAGDLGEVTLLQGPVNTNLAVGGTGAWNSTQAPRWFFLSQSTNNEMTDAEIRGGLDGLILGFNMQTLKQKAPSMKLSQLLEMYYSQRGVFNVNMRACNRQAQFTEYAPTETLLNQAVGMSLLLDEVTLLQGTIIDDGYQTLSTKSVNSLRDYIPNLRDLSCAVTSPGDSYGDVDIRSNITIVLETTFLFKDIEATLIDIFHKVNVNPVGSSIVVITAREGKVLCNTTNSLANITSCLNQDNYNSVPAGVDMYKILDSLRDLGRWGLANETTKRWSGGMSSTVLFVMGQTNIDDGSYSYDMLRSIYEQIPDMRFIFFTTGNRERFVNLVRDSAKDIYTFTISPNTEAQVKEVVSRIQQIPKRLINHRCGPNYDVGDFSSETYTGYVAPQKVNYYRLHANYFFKNNGDTYLRVTGTAASSLTLCHSRSVELPRSNTTSGNEGITCVPLTGTAQEITLRNTCQDVSTISSCAPLYFSIEAGLVGDFASAQVCTERTCPQADNIGYTINTHNLGCFSGAAHVALSVGLLMMSLMLTFVSY